MNSCITGLFQGQVAQRRQVPREQETASVLRANAARRQGFRPREAPAPAPRSHARSRLEDRRGRASAIVRGSGACLNAGVVGSSGPPPRPTPLVACRGDTSAPHRARQAPQPLPGEDLRDLRGFDPDTSTSMFSTWRFCNRFSMRRHVRNHSRLVMCVPASHSLAQSA